MNVDSAFWRRLMSAGVKRGPDAWVRYAPPLFGWAFSAALAEPRAQVLSLLRKVHGKRSRLLEARDIAAVFANFASSMTDAMLLGSERGYAASCQPYGAAHFRSSLEAGKGVILATAQTAGWDIGGPMVSATYQRDVMVVMASEANASAREMHDNIRRRAGVEVVHVGHDPLAALPLLRQLRSGGVVAMKVDRSTPAMRTRTVRFFGAPWRIPEGPFTLAALSGSPIVLVLTRRLGFLAYAPENHPPISLPRRPSPAQLDAAAQHIADHLEVFIRRHPTHYFTFSG